MYETRHRPSSEDCVEVGGARYGAPVKRVAQEERTVVKGRISYTVWSEVFVCAQCSGEVVFYDAALDEDGHVQATFACPHCGAAVTKTSLDAYTVTAFDPVLGRAVKTRKRVPVMIEYKVGNTKY
jgi:transcription initiation factor IIE alpha subunit